MSCGDAGPWSGCGYSFLGVERTCQACGSGDGAGSVECVGEFFCPGPGLGDSQDQAAGSFDQPGLGVQQPRPAQQVDGQGHRGDPGGVDGKRVRGSAGQAGVFAASDEPLHPGVYPVAGFEALWLSTGGGGRDDLVAVAGQLLEQRQLGAVFDLFAPHQDAHTARPAGQLVTAGAVAQQQPGQLGNLCVGTGPPCGIECGFPAGLGHGPDRGPDALVEARTRPNSPPTHPDGC